MATGLVGSPGAIDDPGPQPPPDHHVVKGDGADREDDDKPTKSEHKAAMPADRVRLEHQGENATRGGCRAELDDVARQHRCACGAGLLHDRADRDCNQARHARDDAVPITHPAADLSQDHQSNAASTKDHSHPLHVVEPLAQNAVRDERRCDRLHASNHR